MFENTYKETEKKRKRVGVVVGCSSCGFSRLYVHKPVVPVRCFLQVSQKEEWCHRKYIGEFFIGEESTMDKYKYD
jgi:hypothetical protein